MGVERASGGVSLWGKTVFSKLGAARIVGLIVAVGLCLGFGAPTALAQSMSGDVPPERSKVDENGVDLEMASFRHSVTEVAIGDLSYERTYYAAPARPAFVAGLTYWNMLDYVTLGGTYGWRDNLTGTIKVLYPDPGEGGPPWFEGEDGNPVYYERADEAYHQTYLISMGGQSYTASPGLTLEGVRVTYHNWNFQLRYYQLKVELPDGRVGYFEPTSPVNGEFYLTEIIDPNGGRQTFTYHFGSGGERRLSSVNSNLGYQLKLEYDSDTGGSNDPASAWRTVKKITGINNAVDYCDPSAFTCTGLTQSWPSVTYATPSSGVRTSTDNLGRVVRYTMDSGGKLTGIRSPGSTVDDITITYGSAVADYGYPQVTQISHPTGPSSSATWSYNFSITTSTTASTRTKTMTVTDPLSNTRVSVMVEGLDDRRPQSWALTDELGRTTTQLYLGGYNSAGRLSSTTQPSGASTSYTYDARGAVISATHSGGGLSQTSTATYPALSTFTCIQAGCDYYGNIYVGIYYGQTAPIACVNVRTCQKPLTKTDAAGVTTTYTYDSAHGGVLTETTGGVTKTTTWQQLRPWYKQTSSGGVTQGPDLIWMPITTSICRTGTSSCTNTDDEVRITTAYQSGSSGVGSNLLPVAMTEAAGDGSPSATTTTAYDALGRKASIDGPLTTTDGLASSSDDTTYFYYDNAGQLTGQVGPDPDGSGSMARPATKTTYNANGQPTQADTGTVASVADPNGSGVMTVLDSKVLTYHAQTGRLIAEAHVQSSTTLSVTNTNYDVMGRVDCVAQRMNPAVYSSLPSDACTASTVANNTPDRITKNAYTAAGQLSTVTAGVGTSLSHVAGTYTYGSNSQKLTFKDALNNLTTYEYDGLMRPIKVRYPLPGTTNASSTTDVETTEYGLVSSGVSNGRIAKLYLRDYAANSNNTITPSYDSVGRVNGRTIGSSITESYVLDNLGHKTQVSKTGASTLTMAYDSLGRQLSETGPAGTVSWSYDAAGRRTRLTYPDGFYVNYEWFVGGGLKRLVDNGSVEIAEYAYDSRGRRTALERGNGSGPATTYGYDARSMLSSLAHDLDGSGTGNDLTRSFARSQAGQITSRTSSNSVYSYTMPGAGSLSYGAANGLNQLTTVGSATISHDGRGNYTQDAVGGTPVNTYGWNLENKLTSVNSVTLAYDAVGRLASTSAGRVFVYDGSNLIAEYTTGYSLTDRYIHGPGTDEVVAWDNSSGRFFLITDERGSVIARTLGSATVGTQSYDEYGRALASGSGVGRFGYTGQTFIPEVGLNYYKARFYSPQHGRFMSADPKGYDDGPNMYAYVASDPINAKDPEGTQCMGERAACVANEAQWTPAMRQMASDAEEDTGRYVVKGAALGVITARCAPCAIGAAVAGLWELASGARSADDIANAALSGAIGGKLANGYVRFLGPLRGASDKVTAEVAGGMIGGAVGGAANQAMSNLDSNQPLGQGVKGSAVVGGALGAAGSSVTAGMKQVPRTAATGAATSLTGETVSSGGQAIVKKKTEGCDKRNPDAGCPR